MEEHGAMDMQKVLKKRLDISLQLSESKRKVLRQPEEHWSHPPFFNISLARCVKSHTELAWKNRQKPTILFLLPSLPFPIYTCCYLLVASDVTS